MTPSFIAYVLSAAFLPSIASASTNGSQLACQLLQAGPMSSLVVFPGSTRYEAGARSAWNLKNIQIDPGCIVFPRTTEDVSIAMKTIYDAKARYAVRAAGHSAMLGWNTVEGGVLIHFRNMKAISYNASTTSVTLEPGLTWGEALDALEPHGVAIAGGRLSTVGTGLLLGGGISFLAPEVGFSADTLREVDVVLVTGQIVTATANNEYADLFRALKGGANRFGIATRYVMDGIPTGRKKDKNWFGGRFIYSNSSADAVLTALAHYALHMDDPKASILVYFISFFENGIAVPLIALEAWYKGTQLPDSIFGEFKAIPAVYKGIAPRSYHEVAHSLVDPEGRIPMVQNFGGSVLEGSNDIGPYRETYRLYAELCNEFRHELRQCTLAFSPIPDSQINAGRARGGNVIDAPRGGFHMIMFGTALRKGAQAMSPALEAARKNFFQNAPRTPGLPLYVAESDKDQQVFSTYGSYEFLKQVYKKYDPTRFNVQFSDGPGGL